MDILGTEYKEEQFSLASAGAWIWLLEIITGGHDPNYVKSYLANNNSDVTWTGTDGIAHIYSRGSFSFEDINSSLEGKFPEYRLRIGELDPESTLRTRIQATAGFVGNTVRMKVVHSAHLDLTTPAIDEEAEILGCEVDANAITFTLGIPSMLSRRFPRDKYLPEFCRHRFNGALCQYTQPTYYLSSPYFSFQKGAYYNTISLGGVYKDLISAVFRHTSGNYQNAEHTLWALNQNVSFTISGSLYNDGWFIAHKNYAIGSDYVRVLTETDNGREFFTENSGEQITLRLGYSTCNHSLTDCKLRNNTQNYGGSPGMAGGMYG